MYSQILLISFRQLSTNQALPLEDFPLTMSCRKSNIFDVSSFFVLVTNRVNLPYLAEGLKCIYSKMSYTYSSLLVLRCGGPIHFFSCNIHLVIMQITHLLSQLGYVHSIVSMDQFGASISNLDIVFTF